MPGAFHLFEGYAPASRLTRQATAIWTYQALYVQGRGELRRELTRALRTGRAVRKPRRLAQQRQPRCKDPMVKISDRPAEAADRAVPGNWKAT